MTEDSITRLFFGVFLTVGMIGGILGTHCCPEYRVLATTLILLSGWIGLWCAK